MSIKIPTSHNKVNNLYKIKVSMKGVIKAKCKDWSIGAKNAPSWKKICFQLRKLFFPTGNLKLGGYRKNLLIHPYFTIVRPKRQQLYMVKSFDKKRCTK